MRNSVTLLIVLISSTLAAFAQTSEFTYQGNLSTGTPPVPTSVNHDFEFRLFSVDIGGAPIATLQRLNIPTSNGSFSVMLDFGTQFPANTSRFLEIAVRPTASGGSFQTLSPRTRILSAPFSVRSKDANNADTATIATNALQLGGVAANQYVVTSDPRMTDARSPLPNSNSYIQNQNGGPQSSSNFNVSGTGKANVFDAATQFNINGVKILSNSGANNLFAGANAGAANSGPFNAFVGFGAGAANTSGGSNSFFGYNAGNITQTGDSNSFFGASAGGFFSLGSQNTFIGANAGMNTLGVSANENTFVGSVSGISNTTGRGNTLLGFGSGVSVGTLSNATAIGNRAAVAQNNSVVLGSINGVNFCSAATNCADTNVGIGTTSPSERLHVVGNGLFTGNLTFSGALNGNGSALTNLNAGNITVGTLAINRGGTGLSTAGAAGTFLRSNGTGWVSSLLSAGDIPDIGGSYVRNTTSPQTANFNISGNGIIGGNLAIGPGTPGYRLDVIGRSRFRQNAGDTGTTNTAGFWFYQNTPAADRAFVGMDGDNGVGFYGNNGGGWGLLMNTQTGYVGVGNPTPTAALHVIGRNAPAVSSGNGVHADAVFQITGGTGGDTSSFFAGGNGGSATIQGGTGGVGFYGGNGGDVVLKGGNGGGINDVSGSVGGGGNVRIQGGNGSNGESAVFLQGGLTSGNSYGRLYLQPTGGQVHISSSKWIFGGDIGGDTGLVQAASPAVIRVGGGTAPQRLIASATGAGRFYVNSDLAQNGSIEAGIGLSLMNQPKWALVTTTGNGQLEIRNEATGETHVWILPDGRVGIGNSFPSQKLNVNGTVGLLLSGGGSTQVCQNPSTFSLSVCSSSIRYKDNISDFGRGLDLILRLRPVSFIWKENGASDFGLIAEEVAKTEPLLTTTNEKGEIEGVKYDRVGVVAINAIKEQQAEIESLRKEVAALKALLCAQNRNAEICSK